MKNLKKKIALLLATTISVGVLTGCSSSSTNSASSSSSDKSKEPAELVVATWGGTASEGLAKVVKPFEEANNCKVILDETGSNPDRLNKIRASKNDPTVDVALLTDCFAEIGNKEGLFEKIDKSIVTNLDDLYDFAVNKDGYGPCYSIVRYGIIYNADLVKNPPKSYKDLLNGDYDGMLSLPDMTTSAGPMLLVALAEDEGGSDKDVDKGFELLKKHKDSVSQFYTSGAEALSAFTTKEIGVSVFMDIMVPALKGSDINAKWVDPEEGSFSAAAAINVVKNCKNPELAQKFVNFMLDPETQASFAEYDNEGPTNKNAKISDELAKTLCYGEDDIKKLKTFDWSYINSVKDEWINRSQKEITN